MIESKPNYRYSKHYDHWRVWKMSYSKTGSIGEKVADYATRTQAREETYRLNGWKMKAEKQKQP